MASGRTSNEWLAVISVSCFYSMPGRRASRALSTLVVRSDSRRTSRLFFLVSFLGFLSGNCPALLHFDQVNLLILTIQTVLSAVLGKPHPDGCVLTPWLLNSRTFALLLLAILFNLRNFHEILEAKHLILCFSILASCDFACAHALIFTKKTKSRWNSSQEMKKITILFPPRSINLN